MGREVGRIVDTAVGDGVGVGWAGGGGVGAAVGGGVGWAGGGGVGWAGGGGVGAAVDRAVGWTVGTVGWAVGAAVGRDVDTAVGRGVASRVGVAVGVVAGESMSAGSVGCAVDRVGNVAVAAGVAGAVGLAVKGGVDGAIATLVGEGWTDDDGAGPRLAEACGLGVIAEASGCALDDAVGAGLDSIAMSGLWPGTPDAAARRWSSTPPKPNATETSTRFTAPSARTRRTR